jgi:uncharacterized membrane protein YecN with MAPEG domain
VWFRSALIIVLAGLMLMSLASLTAHVRTRRNRRAAFGGATYETVSNRPRPLRND